MIRKLKHLFQSKYERPQEMCNDDNNQYVLHKKFGPDYIDF
jgi:hypothetical protein